MRILVIFGDSIGFNLEKECVYLEESFQEVEVCFFLELLWEIISNVFGYEDWDILFFVGYSDSEDVKGKIYIRINFREYLIIENFKLVFRDVIEWGLKLVIFNFCDGL